MTQEVRAPAKRDRLFDFRTLIYLYMVSGGLIAFLIHFVVLSSPRYSIILLGR